MEKYNGIGDIEGGGAHVETHGVGGEMWNFRPEGGRCYGYVMTKNFSGLDLERIENYKTKFKTNEELNNIDIVFISKDPNGGQVVIGWYENASLFHKEYRKRRGSKSNDDWDYIEYLSECNSNDAILLSKNERDFIIPKGKGFPGQSNVWYADSEEAEQLVSELRGYIKNKSLNRGHIRKPLPKDIITQIEISAVNKTIEYYENHGYEVKSVETDNVGWDLEAIKGSTKLLVEVKGHRGNVIHFGLTPNEYQKLQENLDNYYLAVVRNALIDPDLAILKPYKEHGNIYLKSTDTGETVMLNEVVAAKAVPVNF